MDASGREGTVTPGEETPKPEPVVLEVQDGKIGIEKETGRQ